jgi:membrane fusion protein (multidrug efflux system)
MATQSAAKIEDELSSAEKLEMDLRATAKVDEPKHKSRDIVKKPSKFLRIAMLSLVGGAVLCGVVTWWLRASSIEDTEDAFITGHIHQLGSRVAGTVLTVAVSDNEHVQAGQLLAKIDPRDYQMSVDSAKAAALKAERQALEAKSSILFNERTADSSHSQADYAIESAKAQINKAKFALAEAQAGVPMARAQVQQREAELTRAVSDFNRYNSLVQDRAVTVQSFETARQNKEVAEANLRSAKENFNQAEIRVDEFKQALADAQATLVRVRGAVQSAAAASAQTETSKHTALVEEAAAKQAKSQYDNALLQLSYTDIVAPVSGTVGHKTVEVGHQIERGQALMSIVSDEKWVVANFKETQLERMRVGQPVDIKIDAFPKAHFRGRVDSLAPASGAQFALLPPDNATGNFTKVVQRVPVKIVFEPESIKGYEMLLTPGMSVFPEVHVGN